MGQWLRFHDSTAGGMSSIPPQGTKIPHAAMKVKVKLLSCVQLFGNPWTVACQAPLSMGLSRQEYWSGLPCPPSGDLPNPGIEPASPPPPIFHVDSLPAEQPRKPLCS